MYWPEGNELVVRFRQPVRNGTFMGHMGHPDPSETRQTRQIEGTGQELAHKAMMYSFDWKRVQAALEMGHFGDIWATMYGTD